MRRIHEICEMHDIHYWLAAGSLIGAVRHNGFIPWDDDMDIHMLRADYIRFSKIAPEELGENFAFQTCETEPGAPLFFAKVRLKGTLWKEHDSPEYVNNGLFVDVFPVDYCPKNKFFASFLHGLFYYLFRIYHTKTMGYPLMGSSSLVNFILRLIAKLLPLSLIRGCALKMISYAGQLKKEEYCYLLGPKIKLKSKASLYSRQMLHEYEDACFFIPEEYDAVLRMQFNDYTKLPPVEERCSKHGIEAFDFGCY